MGLHFSMFMMAVEQLGNEEQVKYWGPLMQQVRIIGCYAQTELGHGSNVAVSLCYFYLKTRRWKRQQLSTRKRMNLSFIAPLSLPRSIGQGIWESSQTLLSSKLDSSSKVKIMEYSHSWFKSETEKTIIPCQAAQWETSGPNTAITVKTMGS